MQNTHNMQTQSLTDQNLLRDASLTRRGLLRSAGAMGLVAAAPISAAKAFQGPSFPILTKELNGYVAKKKVAGMIAAIGFGNQEPQYISVGTMNLGGSMPVTKETLWRIYSQTKPVTGMAAMILVDEGKLDLDQPIADFVPEFAKMKVLKKANGSLSDTVDATTQITPRHLMTHTAGLGYNIVSKGPLLDAYNEQGINPGQVSKMALPGFPVPAPTPPIDEFARRVASLPLIANPGEKWSYSIGLDVLGYIIQLASGVEFGEFLKTRIFDPLGMNSTYFTVPDADLPRLPANYAVAFGSLFPIDTPKDSVYSEKPAFPYGGSGLVSTAYDYDRFLRMLLGKGALNGTRIMSEKAATLGMSNLLPAGVNLKGSWVEGQGFGAGGRVGLGEQAGTFGWGGAAGTNAFVDTARGFRAGGYVQYMPSNAYPFQAEFPKLVYQDLAALSQ